MSEPLNPCPFCGGPAMVHEVTSLGVARAQCSSEDCGILGPLTDSEAAAIDAWNTRPAEATIATLTAEVARLRALLGEFVAEGQDAGPVYYDGHSSEAVCAYCGALGYTRATLVHDTDCLVLRARAALTPEAL